MNAVSPPFLPQSDPTVHIEPLALWQSACGARELPKRDYQHIMDCLGCETLATEMGEALDDLEKGLGRRRSRISSS